MAKRRIRGIDTALPVLAYPEHDIADVVAWKQVAAGTATAEQQIRFSEWMIKKACKVGGLSYDPGKLHTDFNEGRRFLGIVLVDFLAEPMKALRARFPEKPLERGENDR